MTSRRKRSAVSGALNAVATAARIKEGERSVTADRSSNHWRSRNR
jgi:hypothetical protein